MSRALRNELVDNALEAKGAFKTKGDRKKTMHKFVDYLEKQNINITDIGSIKAKYIRGYFEVRKLEITNLRTLQNERSHLIIALRKAGRAQLADNSDLSNASLGLSGGSRIGTKIACTVSEYNHFRKLAMEYDVGFAVCLMLDYHLGLRREEAIQSIRSIPLWIVQLSAGKTISVTFGTKTGRPRDVMIHNKVIALTVLKFALRVMKERNGRLIDKPNLKEACDYYSNTARKVGLVGKLAPHSLRYAFAVDNVNYYLAQGFSKAEAFSIVSMNLGHGDKRGRYIKMVYCQSMVVWNGKLVYLNKIEDLFKD